MHCVEILHQLMNITADTSYWLPAAACVQCKFSLSMTACLCMRVAWWVPLPRIQQPGSKQRIAEELRRGSRAFL